MATRNAFRYLLHCEQQIVDGCDERIGAIEDAVKHFGSHSDASTYGDYQYRPESTLHSDFARQEAVPYRQGIGNQERESRCGSVVSRRAHNEKDQIQASDYQKK